MNENKSPAEKFLQSEPSPQSQNTWPHSQAAANFFSLLYGLGERWTTYYSGESQCMTDDDLQELMDIALPDGLSHSEWSLPTDFDKADISSAIATLSDAAELERISGSDLPFLIRDLGERLLTNHILTEGIIQGALEERFDEFLPAELDDAAVQLCPKEAGCLEDEKIIFYFNEVINKYIAYINEGMLAAIRESNLPALKEVDDSIVAHIDYLADWRQKELQEFEDSAEDRKQYLKKERERRAEREETSARFNQAREKSKNHQFLFFVIVIGLLIVIRQIFKN